MKTSTLRLLNASFFATVLFLFSSSFTLPPAGEYYEIRVYSFATSGQEALLDQYLKDALIPGLHRAGINQVGVFKPHSNDTAQSPKVYVLINYVLFGDMVSVTRKLDADKTYLTAGQDFLEAPYDQPPFRRMEKILLHSFVRMPHLHPPALSSPRRERIYELRSYESPTQKLYTSKVKMFNVGDEVGLFKRLGFNAIFYADVLAGSAMPNLMYMTSFENIESRNEHWKSFFADPQWKKLLTMSEYDHAVSKSESLLLYPTDYSDY